MAVLAVVGHVANDGDRTAVLSLPANTSVRDDVVSGETDEANLPEPHRLGMVVHSAAGSEPSLAPPARHPALGSLAPPELTERPTAEQPGYGETVVLRTVPVPPADWSADAGSVYRMRSLEIDEFVAEHPDLLVVLAVGNDGRSLAPRHVPRGFVDLFSVNAPATATNALTVGASRSTRPLPNVTWRQWRPDAFPDAPVGDQRTGGDAEALAAFSSRGPCQEHERITPDPVAPGTCVVSARSALAPDSTFRHGWDDDHAVLGGTSMADYAVEVTAVVDLLSGPQDFAVAATCGPVDEPDDAWEVG